VSRRYLRIALPASRLLLACVLLIATPIFLGMYGWSIAWLAMPCAVLTYLSCHLQGYRQPHLIALCAASILGVLVGLYAVALAGAVLL